MSDTDHDVDMRDEYDFSDARRGAILPPMTGKTRISIRIDDDVLAWFRDQVRHGGNYQTLMNSALRGYMCNAQSKALDTRQAGEVPMPSQHGGGGTGVFPSQLLELVRQVVREELERAK